MVTERKPREKFVVEPARVEDVLKILFGSEALKLVLNIEPYQMKLVTHDDQPIAYVRRNSSDVQGMWSMLVVEKDKHSEIEKPALKGRLQISKDWHRFEGVIIGEQKKTFVLGMTIERGEKKCEVIWGPADGPPVLFARFRKL